MCAYKKAFNVLDCKLYVCACLYVYVFIFTKSYIIRILFRVYFARKALRYGKSEVIRGKICFNYCIHTLQIKRKISASMLKKKSKSGVTERKQNGAILCFICTCTCTNLYMCRPELLTFDHSCFFTRHSFNHRHKMKINDF